MAAASRVPFLEQLYNHVALPRNLPGREDGNLHRIEEALLERMLDAIARLTPHVSTELIPHIHGLRDTLLACQVLNVDGNISKQVLMRELRNLHPRKMLILHLVAQNCALLIYYLTSSSNECSIVFEAFETSATAEKVLAAKGALQWDFPGSAVSIPESTFNEEHFQDALSIFIHQASSESVTRFAAIIWKAAAKIPEIRDTSDPALISGLLMTILEANGTEIAVTRLRKHIRDSVIFDNSRKPWRRSAFYLVIRAAVQRHLYHHMGSEHGRLHYKTIMCILHTQLLEDVLKKIPLEAAFSLRQKLGRRLAKLESDVRHVNESSTGRKFRILSSLEDNFRAALVTTGAYLRRVWQNHRQSRERIVPLLRSRANPQETRLPLNNSGQMLRGVLTEHNTRPRPEQRSSAELLKLYEHSAASVKPYMRAISSHLLSSKYLEDVVLPAKRSEQPPGFCTIELSKTIREYVPKVCAVNNSYPNQKSRHLLHLMELWVLMDVNAVACFPLLGDYHPGFDADILDPVQLLTLEEMSRAQAVRKYLAARHRKRLSCIKSKTIFDDPTDDCFAARYYDSEDIGGELSTMRQEIEEDAEEDIDLKHIEWEEKSTLYEEVLRKFNENECVYETIIFQNGMTESRHRRPCAWHDLRDQLRNLRIKIFEHPLPSYEPVAKAALFEILCPEAFAAYRDATWSILSALCEQPVVELDRISLIRDYSQLSPYINDTKCQVTLGSLKKAHLESHYATWSFPVGIDDIIRSCGLRPRYYDRHGKLWTGSFDKASFWHHFPVNFPPGSAMSHLGLQYSSWPTSNEVQASQARCPQGLGLHEFIALQGLLVGTHSRWIDLVREMGSTNLNFSSESTWVIVSRLVLQHGPGSADDPYTDVHSALFDSELCARLLEQIRSRFEAIRRNWREPVQMELLIKVLLRLVSLTTNIIIRKDGFELLQLARNITNSWRKELQSVVTEDSNVLHSAIWASLLCKRTLHIDGQRFDEADDLRAYIDASIILQYNLAGDFNSMPYHMRNAIIQDTLFAYDNRDHLRSAILAHPNVFIASLANLWPIPSNYDTSKPNLKVNQETSWMSLTLDSTKENHSYFIHYNYLYGTLLIDGKEAGTLPLSYRTDPIFHRIFGTKNPIVFPSSLRGMDFTLSETIWTGGHRIHLGYRNGRLIIRADKAGWLLEFIPEEMFGDDIPLPLIQNCYHWLHVNNGHVEIRQKDPWVSKLNNWWIRWHPFRYYHAVRQFEKPAQTTLLDSRSELVKSIAHIFTHFEFPSHILVYASNEGKITVELKRLELTFHVNSDGLLTSPRLGALIPQNQDAGTWYGLQNKIVVQSLANRRQKSILVPSGDIRVKRDGPHVLADIEMGSGIYLKYVINEALGRIECAPEPKLLYMKALLHAYTSHVIGDPLTKRTGTEEALYLLQSGAYQPWNPLSSTDIGILNRIAELSPKRGYYPKEARFMETVTWNTNCTVHMQDDRYRPMVAKILRKSSHLSRFFLDEKIQETANIPSEIAHLASRAITISGLERKSKVPSITYCSRDCRTSSKSCLNVLEVSKLFLKWQPSLPTEMTLLTLLHNAPVVGGYDKLYRKYLLTDHLAVDVRAEWGALSQKSLQCNMDDKFSLMFLLGTIAFSSDVDLDLLRVLASFAMLPEIRAIPPPEHAAYHHFRADGAPPASYLVSLMGKARVPFSDTGFKKRSQVVKAESSHEPNVDASCEALARSIGEQWPVSEIDPQSLPAIDPIYLDVERALVDVAPEWGRLTRNYELSLYLDRVQNILFQVAAQNPETVASGLATIPTKSIAHAVYPTRSRTGDDRSLSDLLGNCTVSPPPMTTEPCAAALTARSGNTIRRPAKSYSPLGVPQAGKFLQGASLGTQQSKEIGMLRDIVANFKDPSSFVQCRYSKEMTESIDALQNHIMNSRDTVHKNNARLSSVEIDSAKNAVRLSASHIYSTLFNSDLQARWLSLVDLWPKMTHIELLRELRVTSNNKFAVGSKDALVAFGLTISKLQRLLRIHDAQKRGKEQQQQDEWSNEGHSNWSALDYPDWLLLEIDGDILLREEQVNVALATVSPRSGRNSVLQLLMGKGKTSCILPMVAALLANGKDLARVVVPRALLLQSAQVMQAKLGGLVDRELIHLPFSRKTRLTETLIDLYGKIHTRLRDCRGVLIALPEHILSFKLSGLQQLCDEHLKAASRMIDFQRWLDEHTRDILDECDVSLAIRTQLIYPSGTQMTVDGHPMRWQVTQAVLQLVKDFSSTVQSRHPLSIEIVKRGADGFPLIYFLRKDAEDYLIELLVKIICKGQVPSIIPCAEYPVSVKQGLESYISKPTVRSEVVSRVASYLRDRQAIMRVVNLLRGFFVHRILIATLKKRWNVQYGLHPTRAPIAVPYLAKGVPSPAAEWGHPDVAITLTCLSFYYEGLSLRQFKEAFEHLAKTDEPSIQYEKWFPKGYAIPKDLEDYTSINAEDERQLSELCHIVRSSASLVDFYLNSFVFPKYAKTFKLKLQASGWNLFPSVAEDTGPRVTGFSGTNDSRHQLPLLVQQQDLPQLAHTNAEVPYYLLAPRNQSYIRMISPGGVRWSETDLLKNLANTVWTRQSNGYPKFSKFSSTFRDFQKQPPIRILIDAGAQVLEHSNRDFARAWLDADYDAAAAVYFDDDHRVWALYRTGKRTPLIASPFVDNLERCVVYLDESHCRGTDIKFPPHARAALTLGQHLTKDALVQAAMRLRLLGQTQSITFFSPPEVHQGILDRLPKHTSQLHEPTSNDVLRWVFGQTCDSIEQLEPSYFAQTSHYLQQEQARLEYPYRQYLQDPSSRDAYLGTVRIKDSITLKKLYEPRGQRQANRVKTASVSWNPSLQGIYDELQRRKKHFQDRGSAVHASALEEVEIEQEREAEREVEIEVENVREVQEALLFDAFKVKKLHEDIHHFTTYGRLVPGSDAYQPMFSMLGRTSIGLKHAVNASMRSGLWISAEFGRTIKVYEPNDNHIRPTHWLLWSSISQQALIVSPEEANELIPIVRERRSFEAAASVHLIVYAAPTTRRMLQFNQLSYHATPALPADFEAPVWLRIELGLFAGRLYIEWDEYYELLAYLGLDKNLSQHPERPAFADKPLIFVHEWIALRRKGQDFEHTPMGFITTGKSLTENHPFFRALAHGYDPTLRQHVAKLASGHADAHGEEEEDHDDHDDEEFVPAVEHIDSSESEDEESELDDFEDAEGHAEENDADDALVT
ncbi:p-loop containing nucleoside triphosphate hydrolase [Pyrenophora seminiperda CCB06]|uniref:ubiquitinyl hydrolase 1 n=1 Tax=Pyrenophora seminiperda CCB06 TaxID=1302712 RepID=A0A3M7LZ92_9PLEO|nr:p-loop containing nucleoside triphosphate hydrolase [Pyrenophora seminiperda CCB06]